MASIFNAGVPEIAQNGIDTSEGFIWPSYVEDIMGPVCFDKGFGPFRWVCLSRKDEDLHKTDRAAMACIDPKLTSLHRDNYHWIETAAENQLVVGTKCRILYSDEEGRIRIALKFNDMVRKGEIGPVLLGRDHHDVSGTDSPFRETANIYDGSRTTADMSASNGGNGILLDGSEKADDVIRKGLSWDVMGGVARRSWARNPNAVETAALWNKQHRNDGHITLPFIPGDELVENLIDRFFENSPEMMKDRDNENIKT
jgi:urocanate hydratase